MLSMLVVLLWFPHVVHALALATLAAGEAVKMGSPEPVRSDLFISYLVVAIVAQMQRSSHAWLNWITTNSPRATRVVMAAAAGLHAAGVAWAYSGDNNGTFTITGLSLTALLTFLLTAGKNYCFQHFFIQTAFRDRGQFQAQTGGK